MQIRHDFGIRGSGGLALSIDTWRVPLCSSTAVLRDGDVLRISRSAGTEPQLEVQMQPSMFLTTHAIWSSKFCSPIHQCVELPISIKTVLCAQVLRSAPWVSQPQKTLAIAAAPAKAATEPQRATVNGKGGAQINLQQQQPQKKRKRAEPDADAEVPAVAPAAADTSSSESDSSGQHPLWADLDHVECHEEH